MADLLKFTIPGKPEYVQMVRLAIGSVACKANFDMDAVEDIKVAVSEACKNVFCHGYEGFSDCYDIFCEIDDDKMKLNVVDACSGHDVIKHEKPCIKCPYEGNLGVLVIESLMDGVEITNNQDGKKSISMVKNK